jgi:ubiquitin-conjugating enzyme E2 H
MTSSSSSPCITHVEYVQRFATKEAADAATDGKDDEDEDQEMSDVGSISDDDEVAGPMEL